MAATATLHCLIGCGLGEILGIVIGTALGWNNGSTRATAVAGLFFGYAFTMRAVLKPGPPLSAAVTTALAADTVSVTVMEIVDSAVIPAVPGAMNAQLDSVPFWATSASALAVAFVLTTPVNKWMIGRGTGPRPGAFAVRPLLRTPPAAPSGCRKYRRNRVQLGILLSWVGSHCRQRRAVLASTYVQRSAALLAGDPHRRR
ncbi:DUF4396 domain-containing protein [Nocardia sp. NPDC049190]|uniref:DUF4396 domain-containing protein n=1 Tax=Nocardia sp. NPDC049190 TaxID=3155650 RepID=UPI0033E3DE20